MDGACSMYEKDRRAALKILVEKPDGKRPLGGARRRWETNMKIDL